MIRDAMLMAAGLGTRLRPFTNQLPKPLLPLMGVPMAQFALDRLAAAGVERVVANYHHLPEISRGGLARLERHGMELRLSDESALLLGSAGGLAKARPHFDGRPFLFVNADVICDVDLAALATRHARLRAQWGVTMTLTLFPRGPRGGRYREIFADGASGLVTGFGELQAERPFFVGSAVIEPEALDGVPADRPGEFVPLILERAVRERRCGFLAADGLWLDVGDPRLWLEAHVALMERLELGHLPPEWRRRLERVNRRLAPGVWAAASDRPGRAAAEWAAPAYWSAEEETLPEVGEVPRALGPRAVFYGRLRSEDNAREFRNGIAFGGEWAPAEGPRSA